MPFFGTKDVSTLDAAPRMRGLDTESWEIANVEILQLTMEINDKQMQSLLPKALHPTIPPIAYFSVHRFPDSPVGAFSLAQVRIGCRAGVRPRGFLAAAYVDSAEAAEALASRWGFTCRQGEVTLHRYHDRVAVTVSDGMGICLEAALVTPEPISGGDIQYVANMNFARLEGPSGDEPLLIQMDPEFTFHRAERGRPEVSRFVAEAWNADGVEIVYPVAASFALVHTGFPKIRYVVNPDLPALAGSRMVS